MFLDAFEYLIFSREPLQMQELCREKYNFPRFLAVAVGRVLSVFACSPGSREGRNQWQEFKCVCGESPKKERVSVNLQYYL